MIVNLIAGCMQRADIFGTFSGRGREKNAGEIGAWSTRPCP